MIVSFFGHREVSDMDESESKLYEVIKTELWNIDEVDFYLGGYGKFSKVALKCCSRFKLFHPNAKFIYVTPYLSANHMEKYAWFKSVDETIYPPLEKIPRRFAIVERNKWMIRQSNLVIVYVNHPASYSVKFLKYAHKIKKRYINLGSYEIRT